MSSLSEIREFLACPTPPEWIAAATGNIELLLIDHANCEKKAASTALNLVFRYVDDFDFLGRLSRLAREELRHFEQVTELMEARGIAYRHVEPGRYAAGLRKLVRTHEPARLIDLLIAGAFIEARSCERFACIAPHLGPQLERFYTSLLRSEARHFRGYLELAERAAGGDDIAPRIAAFAARERELIETPDPVLRFHSGCPTPEACA